MHRILMALMITASVSFAQERVMELTPQWEYVADTVMGGVSTGELRATRVGTRNAARLTGDVSLENNGGFIQMAFDLDGGAAFDASDWAGIEMDVSGNGAAYELRLRTDQLRRPWQSFRVGFEAGTDWQTLRLPWSAFEAHRTNATFDPARLRRMGVLAIGSEMQADVAVSGIRFYR